MNFKLDGELNQQPGCMVVRENVECYLRGELDEETSELVKRHCCICNKCHDFLFERAFADFRGHVAYVDI